MSTMVVVKNLMVHICRVLGGVLLTLLLTGSTQATEQKFVCTIPGSSDDHFLVDFDAKTVKSGDVVMEGASGPAKSRITDLRITKDVITFTQRLNIGPAVRIRQVSIDRGDEAFTSKYEGADSPSKGKCIIQASNKIGSSAAKSTTQSAPTTHNRHFHGTQDVGPNKVAPAREEKYEPVDPNELHVQFQTAISKLEVTGRGVDVPGFDVTGVDGVVKKLAVGNADIELVTDKLGSDHGFLTVETKKYGTIRFEAGPQSISGMLLMPSQKKALLELLNAVPPLLLRPQ